MEFYEFPPQQQNYTARPALPVPTTPPDRIWSLGFILILAFIALFGSLLAFFGVAGMTQFPGTIVNFYTGNLIDLLISIGLLSACLAALGHVPNWLLRAGLLLQAVAAITAILQHLIDLQVILMPPSTTLYFSLGLLISALNLLGLICLSYGLVRWRPSDVAFLPLQILLALGLSILMLIKLNPPDSIHLQLAGGLFCDLAALLVLVARPACWKISPLIVFCLTSGRLLRLLYYVFAIGPLPTITSAQPFQTFYALGMGSELLFLMGILILAQTQHVKTQSSKPVPSAFPLPIPNSPTSNPSPQPQ